MVESLLTLLRNPMRGLVVRRLMQVLEGDLDLAEGLVVGGVGVGLEEEVEAGEDKLRLWLRGETLGVDWKSGWRRRRLGRETRRSGNWRVCSLRRVIVSDREKGRRKDGSCLVDGLPFP